MESTPSRLVPTGPPLTCANAPWQPPKSLIAPVVACKSTVISFHSDAPGALPLHYVRDGKKEQISNGRRIAQVSSLHIHYEYTAGAGSTAVTAPRRRNAKRTRESVWPSRFITQTRRCCTHPLPPYSIPAYPLPKWSSLVPKSTLHPARTPLPPTTLLSHPHTQTRYSVHLEGTGQCNVSMLSHAPPDPVIVQ
ncbi:hypothetical protein LZ30DRAFT_116902 [Colletotrichum cereale]|nr:hypothetical protein LZ30DRAFT_116902 [Colletotrichum cereale]